jgi:XTP/dITP diphosphohydrolase
VTARLRLAIASRNAGKLREILTICRDWPVSWVTFRDADIPVIEETGHTYLENARQKATATAEALSVPAVADDSGIEVDALDGRPGLLSARFAGPGAGDRENLDLLLARIREHPPEARTARYRCVALCAIPDGGVIWAEGTCEGTLILEPRGAGGFGYDPAFVPEGLDRTMAELPSAEKHAISHRGKAFRTLHDMLARDLFAPRRDAEEET